MSLAVMTAAATDVGNFSYSWYGQLNGENVAYCAGLSTAGKNANLTSVTVPGYVTIGGTLYRYLREGKAVAGDADVSGDNIISGADVTALYNILLGN